MTTVEKKYNCVVEEPKSIAKLKSVSMCDDRPLEERERLVSDDFLRSIQWTIGRIPLTPFGRETIVYRGPDPGTNFEWIKAASMACCDNVEAVAAMFPKEGEVKKCALFGVNNFLGYADDMNRVSYLSGYSRNELSATSADLGGCSSPLFAGTTAWMREAEIAVSDLVGSEDAALFPSGYLANLALISMLVGPKDVVVMDDHIHMSLRHATWALRGPKPLMFKHDDVEDMAAKLRIAKEAGAVEVWAVVESIYSMDGNLAPLRAIADAAKFVGARLIIDDSHGVGVLGPHGAGGPAACGLVPKIDYEVHVFSLSKALNSGGGAICGSTKLLWLIKRRSIVYIFSAGITDPIKVRIAMCARTCKRDDERRKKLFENIALANRILRSADAIDQSRVICSLNSPLIKVFVTSAMAATLSCMADGVFVNGVQYPAVPIGEDILRISICACHEPRDIEKMCAAIIHALA